MGAEGMKIGNPDDQSIRTSGASIELVPKANTTFRSRKFYIAVAMLVVFTAIAVVWLIRDVRESGLWGQLFLAYAGVLGLYAGANVAGKVANNRQPATVITTAPTGGQTGIGSTPLPRP